MAKYPYKDYSQANPAQIRAIFQLAPINNSIDFAELANPHPWIPYPFIKITAYAALNYAYYILTHKRL